MTTTPLTRGSAPPPDEQARSASAQLTTIGALGWGSYVPDRRVGNDEVALPAGIDGEWIERKTAIRSRRRADETQAASDLAAIAASRSLEAAGMSASDLDLIVLATSTPDHPQPATAAIVQHRIGAHSAAAFDINAVCSGFVYALAVARDMMSVRSGHALVIGVDVYSRILDPTDRRTSVLFGDGAGATVLGPTAGRSRVRATRLLTSGADHELIRVPAGGSREPASSRSVAAGRHWFRMDGRGVREFVTTRVPAAVADFLADHDIDPGEVRHLVTHQANGRLMHEVYPHLGLPGARTHETVQQYGNTGSASIPVTLAQAAPLIAPGEPVLLVTFGGGMAMGLALLDW